MSGSSLDHLGPWIRRRAKRPTPRRVGQLLGQGAKSWYVYALHTPVVPEPVWRGPLGRRWPGLLRRAEKLPPGDYPTPSLATHAAHGTWLYRDNVARPRGRLDRRVRHRHRGRTAGACGRRKARGPVRRAVGAGHSGAASGIGRATAVAFTEAGARVIAVDRDTEGAARAAELSLLIGAPEAWAETVDVSDEQRMEKLAAKVAAEYGIVDVLVNNAGIGLSGSFLDTTPEDWREVLDVNLWGVIHGCRSSADRWRNAGRAATSSTRPRLRPTCRRIRCPRTAPPRRPC